jgi:hypothetical protein
MIPKDLLDINCRPRSAKVADWLYDTAIPIFLTVTGTIAYTVFMAVREYLIWTK